MKHILTTAILILLLSGCSTINHWLYSYQDEGKKFIERYENGNKKSELNTTRGKYTEWYETGQIKFKASEWVGKRKNSNFWVPFGKNGRVVSRILLAPPGHSSRFIFRYDKINYKDLPWGTYELYESWHPNGKKMFVYNCKTKIFTEWNENGRVIDRGK